MERKGMFKTRLAYDNWKSKYEYGDETPLETQIRAAKALASVEKPEDQAYWESKFLNTLVKFGDDNTPLGLKFTLGGRITANIGTKYKGTTLMNCFINGPVKDAQIFYTREVPGTDKHIVNNILTDKSPDSLANIFLTILEQAETLKSEGGYGINFGFIRPRGSLIKGIGIQHPGVVKYMEIWDKVSEIIVQGNNDGYKDILKNYLTDEQIESFDAPLKKMARKGAMMGVLPIFHPDVEEFVRAKQTPGRLTKFNISVGVTDDFMLAVENDEFYDLRFNGVVYKKVKARELYELIMQSTYNRAEPGILFIDSMQRNNPISYLGPLDATNPCFHPDTLIETVHGAVKIKDITEPVQVYTSDKGKLSISWATSSWCTRENAETLKLTMNNGKTLIVTPEHKILTHERGWVEAKDLKVGEVIASLCRARRGAAYSGVKLSTEDNRAYRMEHRFVYEGVNGQIPDGFDIHHINGDTYDNQIDNLEAMPHYEHARLTAAEQPNNHGVHCPDNGRFITHDSSRKGRKDIVLMPNELRSKHPGQPRVVKIEIGPVTDVYDISVEGTHNIIANGVVAHNCGEIGGNPITSTVCLLGSLNLTQYVRKDRTFDWDLYVADIRVAARMLDNVNDLTDSALPQYRWATKNIRQYGMGVNGLGSALFMMGIPYNSPDAIEFTDKVNALKEENSWDVSADLAIEKGPFPAYTPAFLETEWFTEYTLIPEYVKAKIRANGVRNAKTTTNPPLGNSSVVCDNVSNSIEPIFSLEYNRTYISDVWPEGLTVDNVKSLLTETKAGDATVWQGEYNGVRYHYEPHNRGLCVIETVMDYGYAWVKENFPEDIEAKASYIVTTSDLKVEDHVAIQAAVQRHVNQSVSKTANIPNDYPFEDFKNLYMTAWKSGLNGFTTYREGSMEAVLTKIDEKEEKAEISVVKGGLELPDEFVNGPTKVITREGMKFYIHFSYLPEDNEQAHPIAMWIYTNHKGETVAANHAVKRLAELLRQFEIDDELIETQLEKVKGNPSYNKIAKMVSMCLRHNLPIASVVVALENLEEDYISSLVTAVRKFLGSVVKDGTKVVGRTCSACGSENLAFEAGCSKCLDCGSATCG